VREHRADRRQHDEAVGNVGLQPTSLAVLTTVGTRDVRAIETISMLRPRVCVPPPRSGLSIVAARATPNQRDQILIQTIFRNATLGAEDNKRLLLPR